MPIKRILLGFFLFVSSGIGGELRTLSGKVISGDLVSLTDKQAIVVGNGRRSTIPLSEILLIDFQRDSGPPPGKYADVELVDGSLLHASAAMFKGKEVALKLANSEQTITVPLATVSYLLNNAEDSAARQGWDKLLATKRNEDILAFKRDGVLNDLEGTLGEVNEKNEIAFEYESGGMPRKREVSLALVHGMVFRRAPNPNAPLSLCKVLDVNKNVLVAARIELKPQAFAVTLVAGATLEVPRAAVSQLDFNSDKVVYLSDLKPVEVIEKSKQGRKESARIDKNLENGPIQIEGHAYSKGLALHSYTELAFAIDGKYRKLEAILGMDDLVGGNGRPVVKVEGDGKELFSTTVSRATKSQKLDVDVKGVKQLRVVVTSGGIFDFGDHVDLADAKLSK
jgi:hypothetical protein